MKKRTTLLIVTVAGIKAFYQRMEPYPETRAVLDAVRIRGLAIAVCSNWDWNIQTALDAMGIANDVDYVFNSGRVGVRKPHPAFFTHALQAMGLEAADALFVGDTWAADIVGSVNAGLSAVFVDRYGVGATDATPAQIVPDLTGVLSLL